MRVLFFAHLRDVTGCAEMQLDCAGADAAELWRRLIAAYPGLEKYRDSVRLAQNAEYAAPDARFDNADEVALIPPVSGG
jgi:molybdopterin synthase sulfur carrier subunit